MERGMFSKLGLDVKVDVMPSGVEIANALASGTRRRRPVRHVTRS